MEFFKKMCAYLTLFMVVALVGTGLVLAFMTAPITVTCAIVISVIVAFGMAYAEENWV